MARYEFWSRCVASVAYRAPVTEYLEGGTLQALLDSGLMGKTGHPLSLYIRMKIARDIVKGYARCAPASRRSYARARMIFVHKHCLCHHGAALRSRTLRSLTFSQI